VCTCCTNLHRSAPQIGGLDGVISSNTLWFQKNLGWRGALVEALPSNYAKLVKNRPHDVNVRAVICERSHEVHLVEAPDSTTGTGGIWEFMSPGFRKQWHPNYMPDNSTTTTCFPLASILTALQLSHINFFSLDVEGGEYSVLQTIDFNCTTFDVIAVESLGGSLADESKTTSLTEFLGSHGYRYVSQVGNNHWFMNNLYVPTSKPQDTTRV